MAKLYIPARNVEVDDPQVVIAQAFREYNVSFFEVQHYPKNDAADWTLYLADMTILTWQQTDAATPSVIRMLKSFNAQWRGGAVNVVHLSENGQYVGHDVI